MAYPVSKKAVEKSKEWHKDFDARKAKSQEGHSFSTAQSDDGSLSVPRSPPAVEKAKPPAIDPKKFEPWRAVAIPNSPSPASMTPPAAKPAHPAYDEKKAWAHVAQSAKETKAFLDKKDAQLDDLRARTQAVEAQFDPKNRLTSGGTFPKLVDLLGNTGPVMRAMTHLDQVKTSPALIYQDKRVETHKVLAIYIASLKTMSDAIIHIAKNSGRDLKQIIEQSGKSYTDKSLLPKVQAELVAAEKSANSAKAQFMQQTPAFEAGMHALIGAVKLNQAACEQVTGWSDALLKNAERNVDIAVGVRDFAVGALVTIAVGAVEAPVAIASVVLTGAGVKTLLKASDFANSGQEVPWGNLSAEFVTDVVFTLFGKWFEEAIKPITAAIPTSTAGQFLTKHGITGKRLAAEVEAALLETQGILSETAKKFVESLLGEKSKAEKGMTSGEYFRKKFEEIFTSKRLSEILMARLKDHTATMAAGGSSSPKTASVRTVDEVAGSE